MMKMDIPCPACAKTGSIEYTTQLLDIPYFKDAVVTVLVCTACQFKHSDVFIVSDNEPKRYEYAIQDTNDMSVRVIRSTMGYVEVPELGIRVEPGGKSEAYVTNIEGILERMDEAVEIGINSCEIGEDEKRIMGQKLRADILMIKAGEKKATLILEDPSGNSAIIPNPELEHRLKKRKLDKDEVERLSCSGPVFKMDIGKK
jgi:zinc finger protein